MTTGLSVVLPSGVICITQISTIARPTLRACQQCQGERKVPDETSNAETYLEMVTPSWQGGLGPGVQSVSLGR